MKTLMILVALLLAPVHAFAQAAFPVTPTTLRQVSNAVLASEKPAVMTCAAGVYPAFLRSGAAYVGFKAPVTLKCAGATFPGTTLTGATNLTIEGGAFTGRLVLSGFNDVTVRDLVFPEGFGVMGRQGTGLTVQGLTIQRSGAAISMIDVTGLKIVGNVVSDFSGNAGISAYGGGDIAITDNVVTGSRLAAKGVHPDGIQTANNQTGTVEVSRNTVVLPGQGIFLGGTADLVIARDNFVQVDFPNALTWKSRQPAQISGNTIRKLPSALKHTPRLVNYGTRLGLATAAGGINDVLGRNVAAK